MSEGLGTGTATARASSLPRFDPTDPSLRVDPYPAYRLVRDAGPLCRFAPSQWGVTRYREVHALLHDARLGSRLPAGMYQQALGDGPASGFFDHLAIANDPPEHGALRKVLSDSFTPALVRGLRPTIQATVDDLLAPLLDAGGGEVVDELAFQLPIQVVCDLIGIPRSDQVDVRAYARRLIGVLTGVVLAFTSTLDTEERRAADETITWLRTYVRALMGAGCPASSLLGQLARRCPPGSPLAEAVVDNVIFLFYAGFETTASMIGTGLAALAADAEQFAALRHDPQLAASAVQEFLRFDPPVQSVARLPKEPIEVGGRTIRPGRPVVLMLGSAHRDERRWAEPDRVDIRRPANQHFGFGGGPHRCLGAGLALAEGTVLFERLATTVAWLQPAGVPERSAAANFRCHTRLPLTLGAA